MKRRGRSDAASVVTLLEEVFRVVKSLPMAAWAVYYASTVPFVLAFLYFWADMANHAFAADRLGIGVSALAVLFIVLKTGQTLFARHVFAHVTEDSAAPRPDILRIAMNQTILQPTSIIALPISLIILAPFGWVYAFYQNAMVLDDGRKPLGEVIRQARSHAGINTMQNHLMLWLLCPYMLALVSVFFFLLMPVMRLVAPEWTDLVMVLNATIIGFLLVPLCPFGTIVAVNLGALFVMLPTLAKMLLGIQTPFAINPSGVTNPTFFVMISGMTYLCLDPLIKVGYVLRCFYGASIRTGEDLRVKLHGLVRLASSILLLALASIATYSGPVFAQEATPDSGPDVVALNEAIEETMQDRKFAWRFPRQRPENAETGFFAALTRFTGDIFEWIRDKARSIRDWFEELFQRDARDRGSSSGIGRRALQAMVVILLTALLALLGFVAWRTWRKRVVINMDPIQAQPAVPDLQDEATTADELMTNEWLDLAAELLEKGEVRLAMRAYFFAGLARLSQLRLIRIASHKSNREYARELQRIAHAQAQLVDQFGGGVRTFESVWYGDHVLSNEDLDGYIQTQEQIGHHA